MVDGVANHAGMRHGEQGNDGLGHGGRHGLGQGAGQHPPPHEQEEQVEQAVAVYGQPPQVHD